jgi:predicted MFS family arabinose efflux permease
MTLGSSLVSRFKPPASSAARRISRLRADMRSAVAEGAFSQVYLNLAGPGSVFVTSLAFLLGATDQTMGYIFAAGPILQGAQVLGPLVLPAFGGSRRRAVLVVGGAGRALMLAVPLAVLFLPPAVALATLVTCFLVAQVLGGVATNVLTSWFGALVPQSIRGRFLGRRVQVAIVAGFVVAFGASVLKDLASPGSGAGLAGFLRRALGLTQGLWGANGARYAFVAIFAAAALFGLGALGPLRAMADRRAATRFTFADFAEPFRDAAFRPLLVLFGCWFGAVYFGSPFWQPFFLNELGLSLTTIMIYGLISTVAMAATARLWGRLIDRYGNRPVFRAFILLSVANAFVYVFMTRGHYWWIWLEAASSGAMWGGAGVATMNFLLRFSPERKRDAYVAAFAVVTGGCGLATSLLSGYVIGLLPRYIHVGGMSFVNFKVAFATTAALRLLVQFPMYRVRERRAVGFRHMMREVAGDARLRLLNWLPRSGK